MGAKIFYFSPLYPNSGLNKRKVEMKAYSVLAIKTDFYKRLFSQTLFLFNKKTTENARLFKKIDTC